MVLQRMLEHFATKSQQRPLLPPDLPYAPILRAPVSGAVCLNEDSPDKARAAGARTTCAYCPGWACWAPYATSDPSRCAEYGRRYGVKCYTSLDDMMDSEEFDGAFVVTPTSTHAAITGRLLEAGKHVFVEKPLTYSAREGASLARLAQKKGVVLTCGYIERFNPAVETVKKMTDDGQVRPS